MESQGGFLISKIKQIQGRLFEKLLLQHGIKEFNGAQGRILFVLWENDGIPITELSGRTGLAKTTLTSMLDRLEKSGYLQRVYDQSDRRRINIFLTDQSKGLKAAYDAVSREMTILFYQGFKNEEIVLFEQYLQRILDNLEKEENNE